MADKLTLVTKKELLYEITYPAKLFCQQADSTEVSIPENTVFSVLTRLCSGENVVLETNAAENGVKQADSILFQDDFPVLLHNSNVVARGNIFGYLKKITSGLHKPPKDSDDAFKAKRL